MQMHVRSESAPATALAGHAFEAKDLYLGWSEASEVVVTHFIQRPRYRPQEDVLKPIPALHSRARVCESAPHTMLLIPTVHSLLHQSHLLPASMMAHPQHPSPITPWFHFRRPPCACCLGVRAGPSRDLVAARRVVVVFLAPGEVAEHRSWVRSLLHRQSMAIKNWILMNWAILGLGIFKSYERVGLSPIPSYYNEVDSCADRVMYPC